MDVGHYLDAGQHSVSRTSLRIAELLEAKGVAYLAVEAGDSLVGLGEVGVTVLHPGPKWVSARQRAPHGANNGSLVMRLDYRGHSVLLTGDVERETDAELLRWGSRLRADVLKAAHHGSRTSSSAAFLEAVSPDDVVVSCGIRNKFRHPSPEVIERFLAQGIRVHRTDRHGAVRIRVGADGIETVRWLER